MVDDECPFVSNMLLTARPPSNMGAPPLPEPKPALRHFPQWSRTAILTLAGTEDIEFFNEVGSIIIIYHLIVVDFLYYKSVAFYLTKITPS